MAFTTADVDALKDAIATGALEVRYADGRQVKYRSLGEMRQILQMMNAEANPSSTSCRTSVAGF